VSLSGETLIVNVHGCAARFPETLELGTPVRLQVRETEATARVAVCLPLGEKSSEWVLGLDLDAPRNIWGLEPSPEDWKHFEAEAKAAQMAATRPPTQLKMAVWPLASPSAKTGLSAKAGQEQLERQLAAQQEAIAGLQDRLTNSLASVPDAVRQQISDVQEQALAPLRQQLSAVTSQFERLPGYVEQHALATLQALHEQARAELERILGQAKSQEESQTERRQDLEASTQALQKELEQGRGLLESSLRSLPERIHQPIAAAVEDALAQARAEISRQLASELDLLRSEREASRAHLGELGAKREELERWLVEQQALCVQNASQRLEQLTNELAARAAGALDEKIRTEFTRELDSLRGDREASRGYLGELDAKREELERWLAEQQALCVQNASQRLEQLTNELAAQAAGGLDAKIRTELARELDALRGEREASRGYLGELDAKREELQRWLAEQQALCVQNASQRLEQLTNELVGRAAGGLDAKIRTELARELDALRSEREANRNHLGEIGAKREELQRWLTEQQALCVQNASQRLEQLTDELASRAANRLEEKFRGDVETQARRLEADLNQRLAPMLNQTIELRQEMLSLLSALQTERERGEARVGMCLKEREAVEAWMAARVADFQKVFHDALVETTGQIKGRLQMAVEMFEQPLVKLRDESAQQLQEQAARQARLLREHVDDVCVRLERLQNQVESAVRESLRTQAAETSASFGREISTVAQRAVEEWRSALAKNLESVTNILGQQLPDGKK
jgi:K+-transporting ATPase c subunit